MTCRLFQKSGNTYHRYRCNFIVMIFSIIFCRDNKWLYMQSDVLSRRSSLCLELTWKASSSPGFLHCSIYCVFSPLHYQLLEIYLKMCMLPPLSIPDHFRCRTLRTLHGSLMEGNTSLFKPRIKKATKRFYFCLYFLFSFFFPFFPLILLNVISFFSPSFPIFLIWIFQETHRTGSVLQGAALTLIF